MALTRILLYVALKIELCNHIPYDHHTLPLRKYQTWLHEISLVSILCLCLGLSLQGSPKLPGMIRKHSAESSDILKHNSTESS